MHKDNRQTWIRFDVTLRAAKSPSYLYIYLLYIYYFMMSERQHVFELNFHRQIHLYNKTSLEYVSV